MTLNKIWLALIVAIFTLLCTAVFVLSRPHFNASESAGWSLWLALFLGIMLASFTAFWFYQKISHNIAIQKIVDEKTHALASSEQRVRSIIDHALDAIVAIDQQGKIIEWNEQAEQVFGWSHEEVEGQNMADIIIPDEYRERHHKGMRKFLADGSSNILNKRIEIEALHKNGTVFPVELTVTDNNIHGMCYFTAFIRDITERKEARRAKETLSAIVESSDDAIISKELDGTITSWNKGAEHLYGYSVSEAVGQNIKMIIPSDRLGEEEEIIAALCEGKTIDHFETVRITKDGDRRDISVTISPLKDSQGNIIGASKVARDITERKKEEVGLKEYSESLKRSNQELDDFVYIVSHDLKEPIRGLYSYSQFLQEDYGDKLDEDGLEKLNALKKLAIRMEELIDTLLYYSRLGCSELAFRNTDLNKVLQKTLDLIELVAKEKNATITIHDKLPTIPCDRARVGEIFRNLIVNGIKYNDNDEKHIEVGCTTDHKDYPGRNVFYVTDDGIGIDEQHRDVVFKMFKRLHGRDAYGGGTGSGLAFVKKIVDRHGGKIWIKSDKDKGSTFYFTLEK